MKIEIELDLSEATKQWNEFEKTVIKQIHKNDIVGNTSASLANLSAYYNDSESGGLIPSLTEQINGILNELATIDAGGASSIYGQDKAKALADLKEYSDQLMKSLEEVQSLADSVNEAFLTIIKTTSDAFKQQQDEYQFLSDLIDHDKKLIQLLYGDEAYQQLETYYQKQRQNDLVELDFQRQQKEFWRAQMQASQERLNNLEEGSKAWQEESERFDQLQKQWMSAVQDFNAQVEQSIQRLLDSYKNNVSKIFADLDKQLTNGKGMDYISEEWQLMNKAADQYLDSINAIAQIQNFQAAAVQAINEHMGDLKAQQSLNNLMEQQLKYLREKDKLTEYDVERANTLLNIEIKRLALENARQNKSKLRLRRDSQGNYSYQYTSDESQIAEAQNSLRQAQVSLYNLDKTALKNNLNETYSLQAEFMSKLQDLYNQYPEWTEEAEQKRQLLIEYYGQLINNNARQNNIIRQNLVDSTTSTLDTLYAQDAFNFQNMTNTEADAYNSLSGISGLSEEDQEV